MATIADMAADLGRFFHFAIYKSPLLLRLILVKNNKVERHTLALTAPLHPPLLGQGYGHLDLAPTRLLKFLICSCQDNLLLLLILVVK